MPAPEPPRPDRPASQRRRAGDSPNGSDLSAIPTFLRKPAVDRRAAPRDLEAGIPPIPSALPRPATPGAALAEPDDGNGRRLDPATLPMPSLSRRRLVTAAGIVIAALLTISFVRQVGDATAATERAQELRQANAALREDVARLQQDLARVQDMRFIRLESRSFGLGGKGEIPFALAAGAPALAADAPGSASTRLGAPPANRAPLEVWLETLFGPVKPSR